MKKKSCLETMALFMTMTKAPINAPRIFILQSLYNSFCTCTKAQQKLIVNKNFSEFVIFAGHVVLNKSLIICTGLRCFNVEYCIFAEEVILAEERTTEEEKMHIIEGTRGCF